MIIRDAREGLFVCKSYEEHTDMFGTDYALPTEGNRTRDDVLNALTNEFSDVVAIGDRVTVDGTAYRLGAAEVDELNAEHTVVLPVVA